MVDDRILLAGHTLTVFRKTPAGTWLLARDVNLIKAG
jgi:ketosteroid isomerase-like protein